MRKRSTANTQCSPDKSATLQKAHYRMLKYVATFCAGRITTILHVPTRLYHPMKNESVMRDYLASVKFDLIREAQEKQARLLFF